MSRIQSNWALRDNIIDDTNKEMYMFIHKSAYKDHVGHEPAKTIEHRQGEMVVSFNNFV